jgi:hypothetical protein
MTFGSGSVSSVISSDEVQVGGAKALMEDGLLLMVDRRELAISGAFEGILGLGPVQRDVPNPASAQVGMHMAPGSYGYKPKLFLEEAGVDRFSMCFNDAGQSGALRLNVPMFPHPIPAIGSFHWGLGLYGISVGGSQYNSAEAFFCQSHKMQRGQQTPCAAIPDSGTTLMMGPAAQVEGLFDKLCYNWERCRTARTTGNMQHLSGSHAFQMLLYRCGTWMTKEKGVHEIPSVFLTVGSPGKTQMLEITAWSYIVETMQAEYRHAVKHLFGVTPVIVDVPTGKTTKVCIPSFGVQEYNTMMNGPVWILGTPVFYQYRVGYSLNGPTMAFTKQKCGACNETASFLSSRAELNPEQAAWVRPMRSMSSRPRVPHFDTSLPL